MLVRGFYEAAPRKPTDMVILLFPAGRERSSMVTLARSLEYLGIQK